MLSFKKMLLSLFLFTLISLSPALSKKAGNPNFNITYELVEAEVEGIKYTPECLQDCHLLVNMTYHGSDLPLQVVKSKINHNFIRNDDNLSLRDYNILLNQSYNDTIDDWSDVLFNSTCDVAWALVNHTPTDTHRYCEKLGLNETHICQSLYSVSVTNDTCEYSEYQKTGSHEEEKYKWTWVDYPSDVDGITISEGDFYIMDWYVERTPKLGNYYADLVPIFNNVSMDELAWMNTSWDKKVNITLNNSQNSNTLIFFQVPINVSYDADMRTDFGDLRFTWYNTTDDTETEIPYFIREKVDSSWAYVWLNVTRIQANGYETVYMYYDNPSATTTSNENTTMPFFDDFSGNALDTNKWDVITNETETDINVSGGILNMSSYSSSDVYRTARIDTKIDYTPVLDPMIIDFKSRSYWTGYKYYSSIIYPPIVGPTHDPGEDDWSYRSRWYPNPCPAADRVILHRNNGSAFSCGSLYNPDPTAGYYDYKAYMVGDWFALYNETGLEYNATTNIPGDTNDETSVAFVFVSSYNSPSDILGVEVDYVQARKYTYPEPDYTMGSEESQPSYLTATFNYSSVSYGNLNQGTNNNSAPNQFTGIYNTTVNASKVYEVLALGTNFTDGGSNTFPISNLRMGMNETAGSLSVSDSIQLSESSQTIETGISNTTLDNYHGYWLSIPSYQYATSYSSNVTITYQLV